MYHCTLNIYILSKTDFIETEFKNVPAFERFTHQFNTSSTPEPGLIENADIIIIDIPFKDEDLTNLFETLKTHGKAGVELILCATTEEQNSYDLENLFQISDIWTKPLSENILKFYFMRLLKHIKASKDAWLTDNYLQTLINGVPDLIWFKDKIGSHMLVNDSFCKIVDKTKEQVTGRGHYYIWDIEPDEYIKGEYVCMESEDIVMDARKTCVFDEKVKTKEGMRLFSTTKSPLFDLDGSVMGTVGSAHDVTQKKKYEEQIIKNANTDFLTELYNRRYFYTYMQEHENTPHSILFIDLDNFKKINDNYGHAEGDNVLIDVADKLRKHFPEHSIFRMGGDEFTVVILGEHPLDELHEKSEKFLEDLEKDNAHNKSSINFSASIGFSQTDGKSKTIDQMIHESDTEMYNIKKKKKNS